MSAYSDAVLALNPNSYWRFAGGSLSDSGSAGIALTAVGAPTAVSALVPNDGAAGSNAYQLNGSSQYLHAGDNYDFSGEVDWTIIWWMKPLVDFGPGFARILEKRNPGGANEGWLMYGSGSVGNIQLDVDFGATAEGIGIDSDLATDTTNFCAVTWVDSTTTWFYYEEGAPVGSKTSWTTAPGFPVTTAEFAIGSASSGGNFFNGVVDDVAVWEGTALNATQIANLWTIGSTPVSSNDVLVPRHGIGMGRW